MTSIGEMDEKEKVSSDKLEASSTIVADRAVSKYSKPFDVTAKDNARLAAEKVVVAAKLMEMETAERNNPDANVTCHSEL
jgi:hypothetical protein